MIVSVDRAPAHATRLACVVVVGAAIAAAIAAAGCARGSSSVARFGTADTLSTPTVVGTTPMFAVAATGQQAIAWVSAPGGGTDGRLFVSVDGKPPTEIRDSLGPIEAHGETPPKLAYAPNGVLYAVYVVGKVVPGQRFPLSALRLVTSSDNGATWAPPVTVTGTDVFGAHAYEGMHIDRAGTIYVSWLGAPPGSKTEMSMASMSMSGMSMGGMAAAHEAAGAWVSHSTDGGHEWTTPVRVDTGAACPCCRTVLATANDGTVYMAWRHVFANNVRDIVVARSTDQGTAWSAPVRVHADDWEVDACPHAGPSIAVDSAGTLHVAWWTGKEGGAGVLYARSTDGGRTFSAPTPLGVAQYSQAAHVQLALASGNRVIAAWDDGTKEIPQVVVRVSDDGGLHFAPAMALSAAGSAATFPVVGIARDSIAVAWSQVTATVARAKAAAKAATKSTKAPQGLDAVGSAVVIVRRGVLE